ncbi:hypothetical protein [Hahella sp. HN01]|uniref:hypothetical protein n=1 Tax=Hahella sp. HN01 TaxID=2847262 RepID=UPI001C1EE4F1|nr:hypothetical protein [Hahella sp. HN01]MBU6955503.1 hypothetical protein [Hahella sp. HN01]
MNTLDTLFAYPGDRDTAYAMRDWFKDRCRLEEDGSASCRALWESWTAWALKHERYPATPKRLGIFLRFQGLVATQLRSGTVRAWRGVALNREDA